ncbi:NAD(P)H-dependent oxidoreductase [Cytophagaceae bacterium DM2B3-1]|uniref:NAD(P)H-dependent oxidoreductase n=1 Tax=Xanthocytophaga flava TaxID=3048013 RepID=A0ABT7CVC8_9BACT|nr:NAD(P)H-dependent oxidoreductase [Xanthocytophaga flavus]MDJ1473313.1 NAD(P)H-dependent oxidoreductase [Xanthocytophaga flavus]MDJ1497730.1 NAD(P)H-dependent oxidoreductase [Xanthocytophaga flavus]
MNLTIVSASTRIGRQSHRVALGLKNYFAQFSHVNLTIADLADYPIPLFEEVAQRHPNPQPSVIELGKILHQSDAFLFVTPEYNGSYTPALKNMVDTYNKTEFARKAIGIVTVTTGGLGGMRAAMQMQQLIPALFAIAAPHMLLVPHMTQKFDEEGNLIDEHYLKNLDHFAKEFLWLAEAVYEKKQKEHIHTH